ncbi:hypothetical protein [Phenylobacterium aquaticum]|uniref:hypothetical protein n=1 Tax=Phenylobacterium aquaticum TaxID=1763816 RepID=UPI0026E9BBB2|nr:hypothetical protein [Phenylobacterium aquaticum]
MSWSRWRAWLLPALEDGTEAELLADLRGGRAQLWAGERAAMVTQVADETAGRALHVWLAGGDLSDILALKPGVEAWGRAQGCDYVTINGRRGWARILRSDGFTRIGDELRKRL